MSTTCRTRPASTTSRWPCRTRSASVARTRRSPFEPTSGRWIRSGSPGSSGGSATGFSIRRCSSAPSPIPDPDAPVGVLTPRRAELIAGARLARFALELELPPLLRLGRGEDQSGGRARESILATALEALLGAIYLEGGLDAVRAAIEHMIAW
ncbi:MAG: hypothetical protein DME03_19980 [Candidatus Rokuibacteriota bacterium]|nr:MAG: hypothetical protein DME03_19980 [Candidatus Rokubacteria bacterium]